MWNKVKGYVYLIAAILIVFFLGFLAGIFSQRTSLNKATSEYQATISELGTTIETLRGRVHEVEELNTKISGGFDQLVEDYETLKRDYSSIESRLREANGVASNLGQGISEVGGTISGLIESIDEAVKTVETYPDPK